MTTAPEVIDLARLDDAAFDRLYKERIEPCFVANENDRVSAVATFKQRLLIGGGIGAAASGGSPSPKIATARLDPCDPPMTFQ